MVSRMGNFKTIYEESSYEEVINKSRFIGYAAPINGEEEAQEFIKKIKKDNFGATHNVPIYVLGENFEIQRYSDDGEPSGTAGVPVLNMMKNEGITNAVVVITRYFGGVKLGTGGLVRAYTSVAKETLKKSKIIEIVDYELLSVIIEYNIHGKIQNFLENHKNYLLKETIFLEKVQMDIYSKEEDLDFIIKSIKDFTNDGATIVNLGSFPLKINEGIPIEF